MSIEFDILGLPAPQGSKTRMPNGAMVEGSSATGRARLRDWRSACADAARHKVENWPSGLMTAPLDFPLSIAVTFRFPMPKSRTKADKGHGWLWKVGKPDLDKLCRALGDSLVAGGLIARDELIASWHADKIEVAEGWTGARVSIGRAVSAVMPGGGL